uniref:Uncharacterized protein n=1 Tax=Arundo donax TaxID=35708 RepID=A0A0A8YKB3_ARUDO
MRRGGRGNGVWDGVARQWCFRRWGRERKEAAEAMGERRLQRP